METNREDEDIVRVKIDMVHISFDEDGNMRYNGYAVLGRYGLKNGRIGGLIDGW